MLNYEKYLYNRMAEDAQYILGTSAIGKVFGGYDFFLLNAKGAASRLAVAVFERYPELSGEFVLLYSKKIDTWRCSLRAHPDSKVDVSKIAEKFGGGGHPGAAGFRDESFTEIIER